MRSTATTAAEYVAALPPERRRVIEKLRRVLRRNLPTGFEETVDHGMLAFVVPHRLFPAGYPGAPERPLPFINLASQKRHVALYHMGLYGGPLLGWLEDEWPKHTDARLDLGRCCLRFTRLDEIPYELVGELAAKITPDEWIEVHERAARRRRTRRRSPAPPRRSRRRGATRR
jgi:hypothetical protein